jgi:hypothetical protein
VGAGERSPALAAFRKDEVDCQMANEKTKRGRVSVRKYGAGKSIARMTGPSEFIAVAEEALARSFTTRAVVLADQFRDLMQQKGVPENVIREFLSSVSIDDESYLRGSRE